jgi:putative methanogenesis marker protein 8
MIFMDEHIVEAMGKTKVVIKEGKVIEISDPKIDYCPLFHKKRGIENFNKNIVKENMEFRIADFGMCTPNRQLDMNDFLSFGISEILSTLLEEKIIDVVVMVCEGCGTVLVTEPSKAQGIGGRVSGLVKTSPISEIIERIGEGNVLNIENATINQCKGVQLAIDKGYKNIAVTIAGGNDGEKLRQLENDIEDVNLYLFSVHSTGIDQTVAEDAIRYCDVVTSCASKYMRDVGFKKAHLAVGNSIPIFAASEDGKRFIELRLNKIGKKVEKGEQNPPKPLI